MEVLEFILIVILISLSGVMAPGPLFATAVSEGRYNKFSGLLISTGHAIVEVPIIIALFFFGALFTGEFLKSVVGIIGGAFLIYMAFMEINSKKREFNGKRTSIRAIITAQQCPLQTRIS
jgi:threonine/homoserine/homoserine lactone efflux protein